MSTIFSIRRAIVIAIPLLLLGVGFAAATARAGEPLPTEDQLLKAKCQLCHEGHRIYRLKPAEIRPVVERMRKLNPDWMTAAETDHIVQVLAKLLDDPNAVTERTAWDEAVERGKKLFNNPDLGTTGKSCASCHDPAGFKHVDQAFPKFSDKYKRFIDVQEWIDLMVTEKMKGTALPPFDQRYLDLLLYIKSLK